MLVKGFILTGSIELKCRFCKQIQIINGVSGSLSGEKQYLLITDVAGTVLRGTQSATHILGYTNEELRGLTIDRILALFTPAFVQTLFTTLNNDQTGSATFKTHHLDKKGSTTTVSVETRIFSFDNENYAVFVVNI